MSERTISATHLMDAVRPYSPDEFEQAWDDEVGHRALAAILDDAAPPDHEAASAVESIDTTRARQPRLATSTYVASVVAVAAAIAVLVAIALTARPAHTMTGQQPTGPVVRTSASPLPTVRISTTPPTVTRSQAQAAVRTCQLDVGGVLGRMIASYRQPGGGKQQALARLRATHPVRSITYQRDAAAFTDWLARGGPNGKVTVAAVVGRACVQ